MLKQLNEKKKDSATVTDYYDISWELKDFDEAKALEYAIKGYELAKKLKWDNGQRKMAHNMGTIYYLLNDYPKAIEYNLIAIDWAKRMKSDKSLARSYNNLGMNYDATSKFGEALKSYFKSLKYYRITNDHKGLSMVYGNIGNIYISLGEYDKAEKNHRLSLNMAAEGKDSSGIVNAYVNLGLIHDRRDELDSAIQKYLMAMELADKIKYKRAYFSICNNLGASYTRIGNVEKAKEYIMIPYRYYQDNNMHYEFSLASGNLGLNAMENGNFQEADKFLSDTRLFAIKSGATEVEKDADFFLYQLYVKMKDYKKALFHHEEYLRLNDTLNNLSLQKQIADQEAEFKVQNKTIADSLERLKEQAENKLKSEQQESEVRQQRYYTYFGVGFSVISLGFLFFIYRGLQQKKRANLLLEEKNSLIQKQKKDVETQKLIIEEKHKEINDSINYADRLQRSLMANQELLDKNLKEYFIYFNPKETVSGDFYWATELKNGDFLLACADSTGHGVPGAMMSMMNINSLKESVKNDCSRPDDILNHTRKTIIETLANDGSEEGGKDGMDAVLLSFDFKNYQLKFALANNPLWIIRTANNNEWIEFLPDKMPVGRHDKQNISFTHQEFKLQKGDFIFAFTDGYADQFGGEKGKKFKYAGLKSILLENAQASPDELKIQLSQRFEEWKRDLEQVDDVCIIGIKI